MEAMFRFRRFKGLFAILAVTAALCGLADGPLPLTCSLTGSQADLAFAARPTARALYFAWGSADAGGRTNGWAHVEKLADVASGATAAQATLPGAFDASMQKGRFFLYDVYDITSYVQDGLVVHYDAIDNAGTGVHDPAATLWKDLKGTNDISLAGLAFDGTRVLFPVKGRASFWLPMLADYADKSVEVIAGTDETFTNDGGRVDFVNIGYDLCLAYRHDTCFFMAIFADPDVAGATARSAKYHYSDQLGPSTIPGGTFADVKGLRHYAAVQQSHGLLRVDGSYIIGSATGPSWTSTSFSKHDTTFRIGLTQGRSIFSCLRLYDRALTNAEMEHNYAVDRTRYYGAEPRHVVSPLVGAGAGASASAFRYATWNIGHFACGTNDVSPFTAATAPAMRTAYGNYLDSIGADWFGVNEYSAAFTGDGSVAAADAVFGRYPVQIVGPKKGYQWNAAFAAPRFTVFETVTNFFGYHKQNVYYVANRVLVDDAYEAWLVQTHHDWESEKHRILQTQVMIHDFVDKPRVVISGDFNIGRNLGDGKTLTTEWTTLAYFQKAGYHTVNTGSLGTSIPNGVTIIDHIHARGFLVDAGAVYDATGLSDHNAVACRLTPTLIPMDGKTPVSVPANPPDQVYTGGALTPVVTVDPAYTVTWSGDRKAVGSYTGTAALANPGTTCWADGTTADKTLTFRILKNVNWWKTAPSLSVTNWISGAAVTLNVGTPAFGTSLPNYTADMLAERPAGSYVLHLTVAATDNFAGLTYDIPFTVRAPLQATVSAVTAEGDACTASLAFAPADVARTATLVYDEADQGATDAGWGHRVVLGTVPAGATSASFTLPDEIGTRFFAARIFLSTAGYDSTAYVQDGLVVQYDALENAGRGVYCATNAVWKDLVGSRDISSANYEFCGNEVYLPKGKTKSVNVGTTCPAASAKSLELVAHTDDTFDDAADGRFDVGNIGNDGVIAFRGSGGYYVLGLYTHNATRFTYYTYNKSSSYANERQLHVSTSYSGVFEPDAKNSSLLVNGTVFTTGTNTAGNVNFYYTAKSGFTHSNSLSIPAGNRASTYYSSVRLYSRALTDAERAQNYEVDRMRFLGGDPLREATPAITVPIAFTASINRRAATSGTSGSTRFHSTPFDHTTTVRIGNDRGTAKIGAVRMYDRTLSDAERDRNATIDLVRFCGQTAPVFATVYMKFPNGTLVSLR